MSRNWKQILVSPKMSIREAISVIDSGSLKLCLIVDVDGRLLGTVADGDVRRGIIRGLSLDVPVSDIMNLQPLYVYEDNQTKNLVGKMKRIGYGCIPVLDNDKRVVGVKLVDDILHSRERDNVAVIMAGGLGKRLRPLTNNTPKPMLKVGDKPLIETIMNGMIESGIRQFYFSVRYKSDVLKKYFGDGSGWGVRIDYLEEEHELGTAGALSLIPNRPEKPFIVMNGDILTKIDFDALLNFHEEKNGDATMCINRYETTVPYGVVNVQNEFMLGIEEKPTQSYFINAGVYVLQPAVLDQLKNGSATDMPELMQRIMDRDGKISVFPIREYWIDIGHKEDYDRAVSEYSEEFD